MPPSGVQSFFYSRTLPARSIAIARVDVPALSPAQLTDINNTVCSSGPLAVWKSGSSLTGPADFTAADLNVATSISGQTTYILGNQFFELTNVASVDGLTPLFYMHLLPAGATHAQILNLKGETVVGPTRLVGNCLYHSLDGGAYRIQFISAQGALVLQVLRYDHVTSLAGLAATTGFYTMVGAVLTLPDAGVYWIRFTAGNGYQVLPMYTYLPNIPWYPRVRFGLQPPAAEWARQPFYPRRPWISGSFISGKVLDEHMIEFERPEVYRDPSRLPDILVFDKNNQFKYALDGFVRSGNAETPYLKGTVYHWQRGRIASIDYTRARVDVAVELEPDDIVWGFYTYAERDFIYTGFDCNPFTNPEARNTVLNLYVKLSGNDPAQNVYHQLMDASGNPVVGQTNDPSPGTGSPTFFASIVTGSAVSVADFSFSDARVRGGGLAPQYQSLPQAVTFWDLGYWDGKPYPIAGSLAVYLPYVILDSMSRSDIAGRVNAALPMGSLAVIRYVDEDGNEYV